MRTTKRTFAWTLALCMVLTLLPAMTIPAQAAPADDAITLSNALNAITDGAATVSSIGSTTVNVTGTIEIPAATAAITVPADVTLNIAAGGKLTIQNSNDTNDGITVFSDVSASAWYAGAVGTAYEYGLISGMGNNQFAPDKKITRQEAMLMIQLLPLPPIMEPTPKLVEV